MAKPSFRSFADFWPFYLAQHSKPVTRRYHFIGTSMVFLCLLAAIFWQWWAVLLAPIIAYGFAWYSHFFIEGNKPATFGHPLWSLGADFRMFWLMLTGNLDRELNRYQIKSR
ncbi:Mpo1-like protein [Brevibacillus sp. H7]|uniref:Mpo1-like protein n=1 Tax=Brevibacillus sp. H7 TaxID=3349138 RepID=UPI0037FF78D5